MCVEPQLRALFRHVNFQKWSENCVFCTFWLGNVLLATTAHTFSTSQLPKVLRPWCALYILTWKRASRHNGVHILDISTAKSGPNMLCFVHFDLEMSFAPQRCAIFHLSSDHMAPHPPLWQAYFSTSGATNHWKKHSVSRLSCLFAHLHLLSSHSFSSLIFSLLLFSSLTLPTSALPSVHIAGSLTSKLPSVIYMVTCGRVKPTVFFLRLDTSILYEQRLGFQLFGSFISNQANWGSPKIMAIARLKAKT